VGNGEEGGDMGRGHAGAMEESDETSAKRREK